MRDHDSSPSKHMTPRGTSSSLMAQKGIPWLPNIIYIIQFLVLVSIVRVGAILWNGLECQVCKLIYSYDECIEIRRDWEFHLPPVDSLLKTIGECVILFRGLRQDIWFILMRSCTLEVFAEILKCSIMHTNTHMFTQ